MSLERPKNGWNIKRPPVHPGEMLREEFLVPLGISANRLAMDLHVPATRVGEILNQRRAITPDTALRLERYFGMSAEFWLRLQESFDLQKARQEHELEIRAQVQPRLSKAS